MALHSSAPWVLLDDDHASELAAIECLASDLGYEAFSTLANYLALTCVVGVDEPQIVLPSSTSDAQVGVSQGLLNALRPLAHYYAHLARRMHANLPGQLLEAQTLALPLAVWRKLLYREQHGPSLLEREGLQSVIQNSLRQAHEGFADDPASDPATLDTEFIFLRQEEGMSLDAALQALVAFKREQREML